MPARTPGGRAGVEVEVFRAESFALVKERDFMQSVISTARRYGWMVYHTFNSKRSEPGFPDCVFLGGGRCVVAELKDMRRDPTDAQVKWLDEFNRAGIEAYLIRPDQESWFVDEVLGRVMV